MALDINKELKIYWIFAIVVLLIYGLWFFISYESYYVILGGGSYFHPVFARVIGALYIGWAVGSIWLYRDIDNWEKIESWMLYGIVANGLTVIAEIIGWVVYAR